MSLGALHVAGLTDAAARRQTLMRSHTCRPCHDLSKVAAADRPHRFGSPPPSRFGSHFRLTAAVADVPATERTAAATPDDQSSSSSSSLLCKVVVRDPVHRPLHAAHCPSGPLAPETARSPDHGPRSTALRDGEAMTGRTLIGRGGLAVLGGVRGGLVEVHGGLSWVCGDWAGSTADWTRSVVDLTEFVVDLAGSVVDWRCWEGCGRGGRRVTTRHTAVPTAGGSRSEAVDDAAPRRRSPSL